MGLSFPGKLNNKETPKKNCRNTTKPSFHSFSLLAHYRLSLLHLSLFLFLSAFSAQTSLVFGRPPSLIVFSRRWAENLGRRCGGIVLPVRSMYYYCHHLKSAIPLLSTQPVATSSSFPPNHATCRISISLSRNPRQQTSLSIKLSPSSDSLPLPFPSFRLSPSAWTHPVSVC